MGRLCGGARHLVATSGSSAAEFLQDQAGNSVGASYASYNFSGYQCALAIDAAAPVATYRTDLLAKAEANVPQTWGSCSI